ADAAVVYGAAQPAYHRWPQEFPGLQAAILAGAEAAGAVYVAVENLYAYGPVDGPMTEDLPLRPTTRKGRVRARLAEELVEAHRSGRVRTTAGRASDFFGPHVAGSVVGERFFPPILAGKAVSVLGDPSTRHTFTYAPDLARALIVLGSREEAWGRAWHVPNPETTTIAAFAERAYAAAGTTGRVRATPAWALRLAGLVVPAARETVEMRYEFEEDFVVDDSAVRAAFGLAATPLDEALADTVAWWRAHEARG
ncbi:MAG: NAD-dependent epimerase/dehydratase family protein, partial [Acidimicrobiales bacterium]|nr:NAD-dependent epimerase/dehydratase family protein [Acidimicrobiales bacterium]